MATLFKRNESSIWWYRFQHNGKRHQGSTGETSEIKARKIMRERLAELKGNNSTEDLFKRLCDALGDLPIDKAVRLRRQYADRLMEVIISKVAISDAWELWLNSPKKGNPGKRTLDDYEGIWHRFATWADAEPLAFLHEVSPASAEKYASDLLKSGISPRTYNKALTFLRSFWTALKVQAGLMSNPWQDIPVKPKDTMSRRMLEPNELITICESASGWMRYLFALGIYTGMRLHDCACLMWSEVDTATGMINRKTAKRKRAVRIPIHPALSRVLDELNKQSVYVVPDAAETYQKDPSALTHRIQKHILACGIDVHSEGTGQRIQRAKDGSPMRDEKGDIILVQQSKRAVVEVGFHSFRHSFVSLCAANNIPQAVIQELVGHGSPAVTAIYTHASDETKRAISELPEVM